MYHTIDIVFLKQYALNIAFRQVRVDSLLGASCPECQVRVDQGESPVRVDLLPVQQGVSLWYVGENVVRGDSHPRTVRAMSQTICTRGQSPCTSDLRRHVPLRSRYD